jgi:hypothetical protein
MYIFHIKKASIHLIIVSFIVYIFVNTIENMIHYNIGKFTNKDEYHFDIPTKKDWIRIVIIMVIFALLQGFLTYYFNRVK